MVLLVLDIMSLTLLETGIFEQPSIYYGVLLPMLETSVLQAGATIQTNGDLCRVTVEVD